MKVCHDEVFERSTFHLFFTIFFSGLLVLLRIKSTECRLTFQQHTKMEEIKKNAGMYKSFSQLKERVKLSLFLVL